MHFLVHEKLKIIRYSGYVNNLKETQLFSIKLRVVNCNKNQLTWNTWALISATLHFRRRCCCLEELFGTNICFFLCNAFFKSLKMRWMNEDIRLSFLIRLFIICEDGHLNVYKTWKIWRISFSDDGWNLRLVIQKHFFHFFSERIWYDR